MPVNKNFLMMSSVHNFCFLHISNSWNKGSQICIYDWGENVPVRFLREDYLISQILDH